MYILLFYPSLLLGLVINENPQLTIIIQNIESLEGNIRIGVFDTKERFLKQGSTYNRYLKSVKNHTDTIIINDLPKGDYAFMLYHDINSDGVFNRNFLGIPKEPFGFSNNVKPKFAKPKFEDCKFSLIEDHVLQIQLGYFK